MRAKFPQTKSLVNVIISLMVGSGHGTTTIVDVGS